MKMSGTLDRVQFSLTLTTFKKHLQQKQQPGLDNILLQDIQALSKQESCREVYFLTCGLNRYLYMLLIKTVDADNRMESADDITAAATHPMPMMAIKLGVRFCRTMGSTMAASPRSYGDGEP